jgi:hypothetical protein
VTRPFGQVDRQWLALVRNLGILSRNNVCVCGNRRLTSSWSRPFRGCALWRSQVNAERVRGAQLDPEGYTVVFDDTVDERTDRMRELAYDLTARLGVGAHRRWPNPATSRHPYWATRRGFSTRSPS